MTATAPGAVPSAFADPAIARDNPQRQSRWPVLTLESLRITEALADVYIVTDPQITGAIVNLYGDPEIAARYSMRLQDNSLTIQGEVPYVGRTLSQSPAEVRSDEHLRSSGDATTITAIDPRFAALSLTMSPDEDALIKDEDPNLLTPWPLMFPQSLRTRRDCLMLSQGEADRARTLAITMAVSPALRLSLQGIVGTVLVKGRLRHRPHYNPYSEYFTLFMQD